MNEISSEAQDRFFCCCHYLGMDTRYFAVQPSSPAVENPPTNNHVFLKWAHHPFTLLNVQNKF